MPSHSTTRCALLRHHHAEAQRCRQTTFWKPGGDRISSRLCTSEVRVAIHSLWMEGITQMDKGPVLVQTTPLLSDRLRSFNHGIKSVEPGVQAWAWTAGEVENVP